MKKLIIFIAVTIFSNSSIADDRISALIESKIKATDSELNIGIKVKNLTTNKVVYERNSKRYFMPGSALKFISTVSFLEYFGADYKFTSSVFKNGNDYYIDIHHPDFATNDLRLMIAEIAKDSGGKIDGNVFIVKNKFSVPPIMREKAVSDTIYCNGALITKVHLNRNCAMLKVSPGVVGQEISISSKHDLPYEIINNAKTVGKNKLDRLHISIKDDKYIVDGTLSKAYGSLSIGAVTDENFKNAQFYVKKLLTLKNVSFHGQILLGKTPKHAKSIYASSVSFEEVASKAMKISNNFMTDYFLAEFATKTKALEWRQAISSIKHLAAKEFGVDLRKAEIHDASGLSRRNLLTVDQFSDFLTAVSNSKNFENVKLIMACPGDDCTLGDRFKGMKDLYAKTGTLRHVSALIGYFKDKKGDSHSFVIMANNFHGYNQPYRKLEEEIVRVFAD
jgi:D-alanyl-D-alanine carboxypeptidase/D-alanyl-D-alanine-endopeptidase (penicillin-binding protein 4)